MTQQEFEILCDKSVRTLIEENLHLSPTDVALRLSSPHRALVATQIKYLGRARTKLPSYYEARCILPDLAFEQSSSEVVAATKSHTGGRALDLTCGLGVDALYLSKRFDRVVTIERSPVLAALAEENFRRLGATNIEVICGDSAEYVMGCEESFDLIYADPDRRSSDGHKLVVLEECSPNIIALRSRLERLAPRIVLKLSPMFDTTEAMRLFEPCVVEAISDGGECKELVVEFGRDVTESVRRATIAGIKSVSMTPSQEPSSVAEFTPERYTHLIVSDVALRKAGLTTAYTSGRIDFLASAGGYGFACGPSDDPMLRSYEIDTIEPFDPKGLKRMLKAQKIKRVDIMRRDFGLSTAEIARALGVAEGGRMKIAFTEIAGRRWQIVLK